MQGTEQKTGNRCIALQGKVGQQVRCTIYENRPSPCRNFQAAYEHGIPNKRCNEARMAHQLKPLDPTSSTPIGRISPGDDLEIIP